MWFEPGHQVTTSWLNNNTENITGLFVKNAGSTVQQVPSK